MVDKFYLDERPEKQAEYSRQMVERYEKEVPPDEFEKYSKLFDELE